MSILVDASGSLPIENAGQSPGILVKVPLELAFFVKDELRSRIEDSRALALVLIVQFEDAGSQVIGHRLTVCPGFSEANLTIGDKNDATPGWCWSHHDVRTVIAERPGDLDVTDRPHFLESIYQPLILPLFVGLLEDHSVRWRRELIDVQGYADVLAQLRACAVGLGVDRFIFISRKTGKGPDHQYAPERYAFEGDP